MDFILILFAFGCGLAAKLISLPPLVGYLTAGFALHFFGVQPDNNLQTLADLGITLMLFAVGLKLDVRDLLKREIWFGTLSVMAIWAAISIGVMVLLGTIGLAVFSDMALSTIALIGFTLSFSSTVCVVKLLEEAGEMRTRHGRIAIGVLVMQDIAAVLFLVLATGKQPSVWALLLLLLIPARHLIGQLLNRSGHGELLPLTGFFLALGGYELFELVNIKGDLGALLVGMLLSQHPKAAELTKSLLSFKDLFLIGFFLSIGFAALPSWSMVGMALLLSLALPLKFGLHFYVLSKLNLRARSTFLASLSLSNYSEFGLIVAALGASYGWLSNDWLVILALAVSFSFVYTSLLYRQAHLLYGRYKEPMKRLESPIRLPEDHFEQPQCAEFLVIGMGRVGKGAYDALHAQIGEQVWGVDHDRQRIERYREEGRNVSFGDAEDADFWENIDIKRIKVVLLALPEIRDAINIVKQLQRTSCSAQVAAIARYEDEREQLLAAGADKVFNFYTEAGTGFAEETLQLVPTST